MKTYFLTYGDRKFFLSKKHLISLAEKSELFDYHIALGPKDLDFSFKQKYKEILNQSRGGGYWIWKHRIISNLLTSINQGDVIVYCDAGASINLSPEAKKRYNEYISILMDSEYSNFRMQCEEGFIEKYYTYREIFNYFNINTNSEVGESLQYQAGHMLFKKNQHAKDYFKEYELLLESNPNFITDKLIRKKQIENFVENRHDQSIFSILSKLLGSELISNETEFRARKDEQYGYPFLSVRAHSHGPKDYVKYFLNSKKFTSETVYFK